MGRQSVSATGAAVIRVRRPRYVGNSTAVLGPEQRRATHGKRPAVDAEQLPSRHASSQRRAMQAALAAAVTAMRSARGRRSRPDGRA
jgi:hypothetical protein